jgi:hypothetical protein
MVFFISIPHTRPTYYELISYFVICVMSQVLKKSSRTITNTAAGRRTVIRYSKMRRRRMTRAPDDGRGRRHPAAAQLYRPMGGSLAPGLVSGSGGCSGSGGGSGGPAAAALAAGGAADPTGGGGPTDDNRRRTGGGNGKSNGSGSGSGSHSQHRNATSGLECVDAESQTTIRLLALRRRRSRRLAARIESGRAWIDADWRIVPGAAAAERWG